jgi:hypothetical protein
VTGAAPSFERTRGTQPLELAAGLAATAVLAALAMNPSGPAPFRLGVGFAILVLVPGFALARLLLDGADAEWPEWLASAFGLGLAAQSAAALVAYLAHLDFTFEAWALPALAVLLLMAPRPVRLAAGGGVSGGKGRAGWWALTLLALAGACAWCAAMGAPLGRLTDSPDHIAFLRRMAMDGQALPLDAFHRDIAGVGSDPRKGLYHVLLALLVRVVDLDPVVVWRWSAVLLAPLPPLAAYCLARRAAGSRAAGALAAALTPLVLGGGLGALTLRESVYATHLSDALALLTLWAALDALSRPGERAVLLTAGLAFAAATTHVFATVQIAFYLGAVALAVALAYRRLPLAVGFASRSRWWARFAVVAGAAGLACAPYALLRLAEGGRALDPIHTEPQGLLYWWGHGAFTVDPRAVAAWLGWPGLGLVIALPVLWRRRHEGLGPTALVAATVLALGIVLDPLALPPAYAALGYLVVRLVWCVPLAAGLAVALVYSARALTGPAAPATRRLAALALAAVVLTLAPAARDAGRAVTGAAALRAQEAASGAGPWLDLFAALRERWHGPHVVLSDPLTSYLIPAYTGHYVVVALGQHDNPRDPRAAEGRVAARDVLSPYVGLRRTLEILRRFRVDAVVANARFAGPVVFENGAVLPEQEAAVRAKFDSHPEYFRTAWRAPGISVYELRDAARQGPLPPAGEPPRPFVVSKATATAAPLIDGPLAQLGTRVDRTRLAPGDSLHLVTYWAAAGDRPAPPGFYLVSTYLEGEPAAGPPWRPAVSRLYRLAEEARGGPHRQMHSFHIPVDGLTSPDEWQPGEVVADSYLVRVHPRAAPGRYRVRVMMLRLPVVPNSRLADFFKDYGQDAGPVVATVEVQGGARGGPR